MPFRRQLRNNYRFIRNCERITANSRGPITQLSPVTYQNHTISSMAGDGLIQAN